MDALALLCTLHADGPRTTRRLRHLGVRTLDGLRELPLAELAEALEGSTSTAERFLRESGVLLKRIRHEAVDAEAPDIPVPPRRPTTPTTAAGREEGPEPSPEGGSATPEAAESPAAGAFESGPALQRYVINPLVRAPSSATLRFSRLGVGEESGGRPLRPGLFEGLDLAACERLARGGVRTVEELARTSGLDLALDLSWPYDRVFHLKKEASHYLQAGRPEAEVEPTPAPPRGRALEVSPRAEDEGAAGPFA